MRGGNFPLAYQYPKEMRATRDLLRRRTRLVRYSGELKAHVKNTASQYNLPDLNRKNLRTDSGRSEVRDYFPDPMVQMSADLNLDLVEFADKKLLKIEWALKTQACFHNARDFNLLKSNHGVGDILALTMFKSLPHTVGWSNARLNLPGKAMVLKETVLVTLILSGPFQKRQYCI